jgi:hypothetical protein
MTNKRWYPVTYAEENLYAGQNLERSSSGDFIALRSPKQQEGWECVVFKSLPIGFKFTLPSDPYIEFIKIKSEYANEFLSGGCIRGTYVNYTYSDKGLWHQNGTLIYSGNERWMDDDTLVYISYSGIPPYYSALNFTLEELDKIKDYRPPTMAYHSGTTDKEHEEFQKLRGEYLEKIEKLIGRKITSGFKNKC